MVCCGINQSQLCTTSKRSYVGAGESNLCFLNYNTGLKAVIDLQHLIICFSVHPYIHKFNIVKRSDRNTGRNMVSLMWVIRIWVGINLCGWGPFQHQPEPNQQPEEKDKPKDPALKKAQHHYMQKGIRFNTCMLWNEENKRQKRKKKLWKTSTILHVS